MTHTDLALMCLIPAAYVLGAVPFGLLVGKAKGIDIRTAGSGNIGATNVGRLLGKKFFWIVFFLDLCKSFVPMLIASAIVWRVARPERDWHLYLLWLLVGFSAVLGHLFSIFLKFKGGKGVATSTGLLLGLFPYYTIPGLGAVAVFLVVFGATRYISVASILGAVGFPFIYLGVGLWQRWGVFGNQLPLLICAVVVASLIVWKHRANIARLRAGTESKFVAARR
jgi:glycerol-3-phosphate acyltransferase PlsY